MSHKIKIADGRTFTLSGDKDTWYVFIDGKYYCAATEENLIEGLEKHFHIIKPKIVLPDKHPLQVIQETLRSEISSLVHRQEARQALKQLAATGDVAATLLLDQLTRKPEPSHEAKKVLTRLKKFEYADVTHEELVQHVHNLVLRSRLILELSERLRF